MPRNKYFEDQGKNMSLHASLETPFIPDLLLLDSFNFLYWLLEDISMALDYKKFGNPRKFLLV